MQAVGIEALAQSLQEMDRETLNKAWSVSCKDISIYQLIEGDNPDMKALKILAGVGGAIIALGVFGYILLKNSGFTITSWWRSPEHNAKVGGLPNSLHLLGLAYDIVPATETNNAKLQSLGLHTLNEGDHIHAQWLPRSKKA